MKKADNKKIDNCRKSFGNQNFYFGFFYFWFALGG